MSALMKHPLAIAGAALVIAAVASSSAFAGNDNSAGMRVVRDPVTGKLRAPTHEEFKAMQDEEKAAKAAARAADPSLAVPEPEPVRLKRADGSKGMRVGDAFLSYAVVTRKADGSLDMDCVTGSAAAEKIVSGKATTTAKSAKEHGHDHE